MLSYPSYLAHFDADAHLLGAAAAKGLEPPVPGCPGWTLADLLRHITRVHASRADVVQQRLVDSWPPRRERPAEMDPLRWYRSVATELAKTLAVADPAAPARTFAREQTVGFWIRRMAHETLIHRIDAEQAHGYQSLVDPELAADGVAEMFDVHITQQFDHNEFVSADHVIEVATSGGVWIARLGSLIDETGEKAEEIPIVALAAHADPDATISGDPTQIMLWMWGRAPLSELSVTGDIDVVRRFREVCSI